jgi:hypothetical protein
MKTIVLAIDPGPAESAYVFWDGERILAKGNITNGELLQQLRTSFCRTILPDTAHFGPDHCAVERIRGFGLMASDALFDTCEFVGRIQEAFGESRTTLIPRKEVARHVCQNTGVSHDKFIREAIITRFGGPEAIGKKSAPGPLYGVAGHVWAALAVALTWYDRLAVAERETSA